MAESRKFLKKMLEVFLRLCKIHPFEIMQRYTMAVIYVYNLQSGRKRTDEYLMLAEGRDNSDNKFAFVNRR